MRSFILQLPYVCSERTNLSTNRSSKWKVNDEFLSFSTHTFRCSCPRNFKRACRQRKVCQRLIEPRVVLSAVIAQQQQQKRFANYTSQTCHAINSHIKANQIKIQQITQSTPLMPRFVLPLLLVTTARSFVSACHH